MGDTIVTGNTRFRPLLPVRCPMCRAQVRRLVLCEFADGWLAQCPCIGFADGTGARLCFIVPAAPRKIPPLPKRWLGWHLRWTAAGMRELAQAWHSRDEL